MESSPIVSIIMIFYNAEKFIREAIESVCKQTYNAWELLLVDDGSTDGSTKIAKQFAEQNPRKARYLQHNGHVNRGMSASRNLGISKAGGKYIAFLDSDDVWVPHKLEQQVAILESHAEAAMVYGPARYWYSWTGNPEDAQRDFLQAYEEQYMSLVMPPRLLILFLQREGDTPSPSCIVVRTEVARDLGGFEESFPGMFEDQVFYTKICSSMPVFVSEECWYKYRQHPEACCSIISVNGQYDFYRSMFLTWANDFIRKLNIRDKTLRKVLQKELRQYHRPFSHRIYERMKNKLPGILSF